MLTRRVQYYFYSRSPATQSAYRDLFVYLYEAFNDHWISYNEDSPPVSRTPDADTDGEDEGEKGSHITIMDFERVFEVFKKRMVRRWMAFKDMEIQNRGITREKAE